MKRPALRYFQPLKIYSELDIIPLLFDFRAEHEPDDDALSEIIGRLYGDYNTWLATDDSAEAVLTQIIKSYPSYWSDFVEYASRRHDLDIAEEFIRVDLYESDCTVSSSVHSLWIAEEDDYRSASSDRLPEYRPESIRDGEWPLHAAFESESDAITYFEAVIDGRKE